ncbi:MAG: putative hydroxymethylpyrimidine transport system permease protein [Blastocatellia bacterium]
MRAYKFYQWFVPWLYLLGILMMVELFIRISRFPEYLLPTPSIVILEIWSKFPLILDHLAITLSEAILGFIGGNICAILFGFLFSSCQPARQGLYPIVVGMQAVPVVALAPFIIIWFGSGITGKAIMAGLICYFPATVISTDGFTKVNRDGLLLLESMGAGWWQIFKTLRLPSAIPGIMSALQVSASLCTIGAVVAELAGASKGVGYLIVRASYEFRTPMLFAVLSLTSLATFFFFKTVQLIGEKYARKYSFSYSVPIY